MNKFKILKATLLKEVYTFGEDIQLTEKFERDFLNLINICTFSLMKENDNFFGLFTMQMKRKIDFKIMSAIGTTLESSNFIMYFNPIIFLEYDLEEMKALIKHEIYHIMFQHFKRSKDLRKKYSNFIVNTALDISINQYIENLPQNSFTIESVNWSFKTDLEYEKTVEHYAEKLNKALNKLKGNNGPTILKHNVNLDKKYNDKIDITKAHDIWEKANNYINIDQLNEITKKIANNSKSGQVPNVIEKALNILNEKPEISWNNYLKKTIGTMPLGYKKTITRRDRRQPNRLDIRGKLSRNVVQIIVALDISGSMSDDEIKKIMIEIFNIVKNYPSQITIIECDDSIRRVYKVRTPKDIKKKVDTKGGTRFSAVFEYINSNGLRNHLLIYFTDGMGEEQLTIKPINYKTLWVLTGKNQKLSLNKTYGEVKNLSNKDIQKNDVKIAIDDMGEIVKDWACAANQYI